MTNLNQESRAQRFSRFAIGQILTVKERDIWARFFYAFILLSSFVRGLLSPESLAFQMVRENPLSGHIMIAIYGILSVLLFFDTYVNDVQPPDHQLKWTSRYRHLLLVAASLVYLTSMYISARTNANALYKFAEMFRTGGFACMGLILAWRDVSRRPGHLRYGV